MINKFLEFTRRTLKYYHRMPYYAVAKGRVVGIFKEWNSCNLAVKSFKGARYKKFPTRELAENFLKENGLDESIYLNSDSDNSNPPPSTSKPKCHDFWPNDEENNCSSGDDEFLLEASAEVEGVTTTKSTGLKRKFSSETVLVGHNKISKTDLTLLEPVGIKKFGKFNFPIDSEGYVICYTDGSCINNGQKNAVAGFGVYFSENHPLNTAKPVIGRATNNVGEIQASIYAIKIVKAIGISKLSIITDSQFLISSITKWIGKWKRNNWRTKKDQLLKNVDDFKELDGLLVTKDVIVKWNHVRGHVGVVGNEMADKLARQGAQMYQNSDYN